MHGVDKELVEHRMPICEGKKLVKQAPRRYAPNVLKAIKAKIKRLLKAKFIRTTRYVNWISNIVLMIKKNGKMHVCIDFRDLNAATPKDECPLPIANMLIDSTLSFQLIKVFFSKTGNLSRTM